MGTYLYSRKSYPSRGIRPERDYYTEAVNAGSCVICGDTLIRKVYRDGKLEQMDRFIKRLTCGNYYDEHGFSQKTDCRKAWLRIPENNGRFKGIMPKCTDCHKRISYVNPGESQHDRCFKCYDKLMRKGGYNNRVKKNLLQYAFKKGHVPSHPFKKGESYNRGKTFEEAFGVRVAKRMKAKLSEEMKKKVADGRCGNRKPKQKINCKVCDKEMLLSPYYAKTRKTCSFYCSGMLGGRPLNNTAIPKIPLNNLNS